MKTVKIYESVGLKEWQVNIPIGKAKLLITFSGGMILSNGFANGKFSTDNPIAQHAIENSDYFKSGRIRLYHQFQQEGESSVRTITGNEASAPVSVKAQSDNATTETKSKEKQEVEVTCLEDAAEYLKNNFGVKKTHIRKEGDADTVGAEFGIKFIWL